MKVTETASNALCRRSALRIALVFVFVSVGWIVVSDRLVGSFQFDPNYNTLVQTFKGTLYVVVVGWLIYAMGLRAYRSIDRAHNQETQAALDLVSRLAMAVEFRDGDCGKHIDRMAAMVYWVSKCYGFDDARADLLSRASLLHDIGKLGVADEILLKQGPLTDVERTEMQLHVEIGTSLLRDASHPLIRLGSTVIETHHENWDGSGYPKQLSGAEIPIEGRIVAICDVFDALISKRPYKEAWVIGDAVAEILKMSNKKFDPLVVEAFKRALPELQQIVESGCALPSATDF